MVKGLEKLKEYLEGYDHCYIIIGGTACEVRLRSRDIRFRATKDIDILLVIEAIDYSFLEQFWDFIRDGDYDHYLAKDGHRQMFRFCHPAVEDFPPIIELFSRRPDSIVVPEGFHLTPIPAEEELSSLSALLLDDQYYQLTLENAVKVDRLMVANEVALICLKVKAFLNNLQRSQEGQQVRSNDIDKHKKDVLKLVGTMPGNSKVQLPDAISQDLTDYVTIVRKENPDIRGLANESGLGAITLDEIIERIEQIFSLPSKTPQETQTA